MMSAAAAAAELEAFGAFYGALAAREYFGDHICLAAQPERANGTVEDLVERGVEEGAAVTAKWAEQIVEAVSDRTTSTSVQTALGGLRFDVEELARVVERAILHSAMLGALDSEWEREHEEEIAPATFAATQEGAFASLPFSDAIRLFEERRVLPKAAFDALQQGARRTAFTVAGMASQEMLNVTRAELLGQLARARKAREGLNLQDFRRFAKERLESAGWTPANKSHVETVLRTNAVGALASGRFVEQRKPDVLAALPYWQIRGVNDSRARPTHRAAFGIVLRADHAFWKTAYPPFGFNCLLPGTAVRGVFRGASRAHYAGKAIELTTAKGRRLSVTANHPVLTRRGFVPAQALREGDELISYRDEPWIAPLGESPERDEYEQPARVEEVFRALAQTGGPLCTGAGPDDFHGEAKRFVGQVEVVGSYANLTREWEPAPGDELPDLALEATDALALSPSARRAPLGPVLLPAPGEPGLPALSFDRAAVTVQRAPFSALRIAAPAELDAVLTEAASEGLTRDTELVGELLQRGTSHVALDQVRSVREFEFCGHVYDVETASGWLAADSIVVGNCRCRVTARTVAWMKRTGTKLGPVPTGLPDPGFDSGTSRLISVPDAALAPAEQPQAAVPSPVQPPVPTALPAPQYPPPLPPLLPPQFPPLPPPLPVQQPVAIAAPPPPPPGVPIPREAYDQLTRRFAASLNTDVRQAFTLYTANHYRGINSALRGGKSVWDSGIAGAMQTALKRAKQRGLAAEGVVYRGDTMSLERLAEFVPGQTVTLRGFTSTTIKGDIADMFSADDYGAILAGQAKRVILTIRQRSAVPVEAVSSNPGEAELLLPHETKLRVISRREGKTALGDDAVLIEVEEVAP